MAAVAVLVVVVVVCGGGNDLGAAYPEVYGVADVVVEAKIASRTSGPEDTHCRSSLHNGGSKTK
jgi:hypothetical protein